MDELFDYMLSLLETVPTDFIRYIDESLPWGSRMFGLTGPRGVGKTTLFLQHVTRSSGAQPGNERQTLYITADHMYFATHSLYETAREFNHMGGSELLIDEIHKYPDWSRELKMIYDGMPDMKVAFTGSSVLDIAKREADLSRRAPIYSMQGLSFREYLAISHGIEAPRATLKEILANQASIPNVQHPLQYFVPYLHHGYYPFGEENTFERALEQVVTQTLEVDIPQYAGMNMATGIKLKRLLGIISTLVPFKPNMTKLAAQIGASRNSIEDYLGYMERAGMIAQLKSEVNGLAQLGKVEKVYLDNPNILYSLGGSSAEVGTVRETFFFNQMRVRNKVTASPISDFQIGNTTFKVGGHSKGQQQISKAEHGIVVKDDIEHGHGNVVPLWAFGLNY